MKVFELLQTLIGADHDADVLLATDHSADFASNLDHADPDYAYSRCSPKKGRVVLLFPDPKFNRGDAE